MQNVHYEILKHIQVINFFIKASTTLLLEIDPKLVRNHLCARNHSVVSKIAAHKAILCTVLSYPEKPRCLCFKK